MAKAFSVASWNVEHFRSQKVDSRVTDVVAFLDEQKPDVFGLYEVEGKKVFEALTTLMPSYTFHITEGRQTQQILLGVTQGLTAFFTQKTEFKEGTSLLRPGALLTVRVDGENYPLLFLHTKSGNDPRGLGLRDDMLVRACKFVRALDKTAPPGKKANYVFLGDFNMMGMEYLYDRDRDILAANELQRLRGLAKRQRLRILERDEDVTWWGGGKIAPSGLDYVVARDHMQFAPVGSAQKPAEVSVRGWPKLPSESEKKTWVTRYSDHALLYFEVQKVV
jgi:endonuclease/exonuclease/phosphatase family metal-dependent hydrolase